MSFENRLKRGLESRAADMEDDVSTALKDVRDGGARRHRMYYAGGLVAAAALIAVAALAGPSLLDAIRGTEPSETPIAGDPTPTPSTEPTPEPTPTEEPPVEMVARPVWFTSGEMLQSTTRFVEVAAFPVQADELIGKLLAGPNQIESDNSLGTAIPVRTQLRGIELRGDRRAVVNLSEDFVRPSDGDGMGQRVAQIVYTLEHLAPDGVFIEIEGENVGIPGVEVDQPYTTEEFEPLLMPITVRMPFAGQEVGDPVITVAGTANVFEATVTISIVDAEGWSVIVNDKGKVIDETFTTATCGTGCRGTYEIDVPVRAVDPPQQGTVIVYELSAESGEPINEVRIPVALGPRT